MTAQRVLILGAGAAGTAAARVLAPREDVRVTLVARTEETPYTRMLVKGVAFGPTPPEMIRLPLPDVEVIADTVAEVDATARRVSFASGSRLDYDALIVATGSAPRTLPTDVFDEDTAAPGRVSALHSLGDALRIRALLTGLGRPARVTIHGGGIIAAETASTLHADGHDVVLVARSDVPGVAAFGEPLAQRLAAEHAQRVTTRFGRTLQHVDTTDAGIETTLDDGSRVESDLLLIALGTVPAAPPPWAGGIDVDDRLRAGEGHVYAAGGVAVHHDTTLGTWRIDHWEDATAQGEHAAQSALHGVGLADDPGAYLPRSPYMAMVHGLVVSGVGTTSGAQAVPGDGQEFTVRYEKDGAVVGVTGIDSVGTVYAWGQRLHSVRV